MTRNRLALAGSAGAVAAVALALGGCAAWALPLLRPMPLLWCFVPLAWCIWTVLVPGSWVPDKLPLWGALLGAIGWLFAAMIVNLPARLLGVQLPLVIRVLVVVPLVAIYYFLWTAIREVYVRLVPRT